jgi:hypothetical protein
MVLLGGVSWMIMTGEFGGMLLISYCWWDGTDKGVFL